MVRSKLEVVRDILEYCRYAPKRISWIMQIVHVDSAKGPKLIRVCERNGLLQEVPMKNYLRKGYLTTKAGREFISKLDELVEILQETIQAS